MCAMRLVTVTPTPTLPPPLRGSDSWSNSVYGRTVSFARRTGTCVACGRIAHPFRTDAAAREYETSATCQRCQDRLWTREGQ